ncbi:MAG: tripartite tricarboxylate transporter substrate binding protein [Rhodovarius sp.]|nr:tripartite tricarboxylate transporter substrate binding protein [Rhodovarius sp.]MCX7932968.1 tripartite tricarboxylate transporter substrate binding protein [Rhodovarius sp.]MDW8315409.1 tripartite tricarboxylate transporter substrate binding protein [Rhodovarius sp.]
MLTRRLALAAPALLASPALAWLPDRPIRLVIPFTPGGTNDIIGRLVADGMAQRLGQPIVIENRGGAGGMIGADIVAKAAPDGHTLLLGGSGSLVITSFVHRRLPYDPIRDFAPIGLMGSAANVIVVNPQVPASTLRELQAVARRAQPPLTYASPGVGSTGHAAGALLAQALEVEMIHVPYRGTGPVLTDLIAGRVQVFTNALAPMQPQVLAGQLRALAIAGRQRSTALPDVPTTIEAGFPSVQAATWFSLFATGGTPPERLRVLHAALNATMAEPEVRRRLTEGGVDIETSESPEAFWQFYLAERARWGEVIRRANIQAEG